MASVGELLEGKRVCICAGSGGVGKTTTSAAIAAGMAMRGQEGRGADDRPGQAPGRLAGPARAGERGAPGRPRAVHRGRRRSGRRRALGDDARPEGDLRRGRPQARAGRGDARADPREPDLPAALERARGLAGIHGDGEAVRDLGRGPLRPAGPRHAAVTQRARLPRGAEAPDPVHRGPGAPRVHGPDRHRREGRRPRHLRDVLDPEADHGRRPAPGPGRVLPGDERDGERLPRAGATRERAARRLAEHVPGGLRPPGRADRRGRLLPPQAGRGEAAVRRGDRQQGPLRGRGGRGARRQADRAARRR